MERLLDVIAVFSVLLIGLVLGSVRRAHIRVEYSVSWLLAGIALLVLSRWHTLQQWLARVLGVEDTPLALLTICGVVFLVVLYRLSLVLSDLKDTNIALTQRLAILEFQLNEDKRKGPNDSWHGSA